MVALLLAASLTVVGTARPAAADPVCSSNNPPKATHLCTPTASPATGTTATTFLFSVVYDDQMARAGAYARLQANDEVEITGRRGAWVQVRTPLGGRGLDPSDHS